MILFVQSKLAHTFLVLTTLDRRVSVLKPRSGTVGGGGSVRMVAHTVLIPRVLVTVPSSGYLDVRDLVLNTHAASETELEVLPAPLR